MVLDKGLEMVVRMDKVRVALLVLALTGLVTVNQAVEKAAQAVMQAKHQATNRAMRRQSSSKK